MLPRAEHAIHWEQQGNNLGAENTNSEEPMWRLFPPVSRHARGEDDKVGSGADMEIHDRMEHITMNMELITGNVESCKRQCSQTYSEQAGKRHQLTNSPLVWAIRDLSVIDRDDQCSSVVLTNINYVRINIEQRASQSSPYVKLTNTQIMIKRTAGMFQSSTRVTMNIKSKKWIVEVIRYKA